MILSDIITYDFINTYTAKSLLTQLYEVLNIKRDIPACTSNINLTDS